MKLHSNLSVLSGKMDIAPLIDVVFLLLIFLVLSSSFVFHSGLPVGIQMPKSKAARMHATEKIVVVLAANGDIYLNDTLVEWGNVEKFLTDIAFERKAVTLGRMNREGAGVAPERAPRVLLRADEGVPYGRVVKIMDLARSLNMGVFLATDPET